MAFEASDALAQDGAGQTGKLATRKLGERCMVVLPDVQVRGRSEFAVRTEARPPVEALKKRRK